MKIKIRIHLKSLSKIKYLFDKVYFIEYKTGLFWKKLLNNKQSEIFFYNEKEAIKFADNFETWIIQNPITKAELTKIREYEIALEKESFHDKHISNDSSIGNLSLINKE